MYFQDKLGREDFSTKPPPISTVLRIPYIYIYGFILLEFYHRQEINFCNICLEVSHRPETNKYMWSL